MLDSNQKTSLRLLSAVLLSVLGVILAPTIAEFLVAIVNRYRTYPTGTDTNMLANTTILQALIVLITLTPLVLPFKKRQSVVIASAFIVLFLIWISMFIPSFLPKHWCKHELRIYSCESGLRYQY